MQAPTRWLVGYGLVFLLGGVHPAQEPLPRDAQWDVHSDTCVLKHYKAATLLAKNSVMSNGTILYSLRTKVQVRRPVGEIDSSLAALSPCIAKSASRSARGVPIDAAAVAALQDAMYLMAKSGPFQLNGIPSPARPRPYPPSIANLGVYGEIRVRGKPVLAAVLSAAPVCQLDGPLGGACSDPPEVSLLLYFLIQQRHWFQKHGQGVWADTRSPVWWDETARNLSFSLKGRDCVAKWNRAQVRALQNPDKSRSAMHAAYYTRIQCPLDWDTRSRQRVSLTVSHPGRPRALATVIDILLEARGPLAPPANLSVLVLGPL